MRWLESVRLRMSPHRENQANRELQAVVGRIGCEEGLNEIKLFVNALQAGDIALNLYWDTPKITFQGSRLGLSLVATIKRFGMVNHSIWTEPTALAICEEPRLDHPRVTGSKT